MATVTIGDRVGLNTRNLEGTVMFIGEMIGRYGIWYGIELNAKKGLTDGSFKKIRYFKTKKNKGMFVKKHQILSTNSRNNRTKLTIYSKITVTKLDCNGIIKFIGNIEDKNGIFYGIELEKPIGKNNGTFKNRVYFKCSRKYGNYGIFTTRNGITSCDNKLSPVSTAKRRKQIQQNAINNIVVSLGDTVQFLIGNRRVSGLVQFIGKIKNKMGIWYGIELDSHYGKTGKNDGSVNNINYFTTTEKRGIFIKKKAILQILNNKRIRKEKEMPTLNAYQEYLVIGYIREYIEDVDFSLIIPYEIKLLLTKFVGNALLYSYILDFKEMDDLLSILSQQISKQQFRFLDLRLIYRGSRDGHTGWCFHNKCDDISNTVTIIRTQHSNHVFGGYTPHPFKKQNKNIRYNKYDEETFLFLIRSQHHFSKTHVPMVFGLKQKKKRSKTVVMKHGVGWGPVFGDFDIRIYGRCDGNVCKGVFDVDTDKVGTLCGADCSDLGVFHVREIEVFELAMN